MSLSRKDKEFVERVEGHLHDIYIGDENLNQLLTIISKLEAALEKCKEQRDYWIAESNLADYKKDFCKMAVNKELAAILEGDE